MTAVTPALAAPTDCGPRGTSIASTGKTVVDGVLVVYHRPAAPWIKDASTVREHLHAFARHSRHRVWEVNVDIGFPRGLADLEFRAIIMHYSVFGMGKYHLDERWLEYIDASDAFKVAFFQDECTRCQRRFAFLNDHAIDCVYTCLESSEFDKVYRQYTSVPRLVSNIPGYVSEALIEAGRQWTVPRESRTVDVGYRGRPLPAYLGHGAMEKHQIGVRFEELARASGLRLDLAAGEGDRLYGSAWYRFMANCRCVLGVESGVSAFDLEDEVLNEFTQLQREGRSVALDDLETLPRWEDVVYYRTVSPRHFEAAALRVTQVLFEGRYSGVMQPMVHYIPLRKDFANIDEVIALIRDDDVCAELADNAYRDLIASGNWSYERFVAGVDTMLDEAIAALPEPAVEAVVARQLALDRARQRRRRIAEWAVRSFLRLKPVRQTILFVHPVTSRIRRLLRVPGPEPT
jgi:hypothetical protein